MDRGGSSHSDGGGKEGRKAFTILEIERHRMRSSSHVALLQIYIVALSKADEAELQLFLIVEGRCD